MRFPRPALVALLLALSTAGLVAQGVIMGRPGRIGPRDNVAPKTGTSRLRGRVVGGESGQPLRKAVVMLSGQDLGEGRVASTDEEGRWELKDLPAGRFQLHASKGGFVQLAYGQRRPFEQGRPIELAEGQTLENVNFNLPRGSVITGRIVDEYGEPIADATVSVMRYRYMNGRRRMIPAGRFAQSDDIGSFRLFGLAPGAYYVSATMRPMGMMGMNAGEGNTSYAPTYYPGTGSAQQAEAINVGLGAEVSGITFALQPVRTVKVSGTAVDSSGKPMAGAFVMLREDMRSGDGGMMMMFGGGNRVRDDGTFELSNVTPGDYIIEARPMMMGPPRRGDGDPEAAFGSVSVGGEDVTGVALMGTRGTSIRGHVVMQPAAAVGGVKPSEISVNAMAKNADAPMLFMGGEMRDRLEDDWTFELKAVQSPVLIRSFRLPPGYTLKSVTLNGVDVTDSGIAFKTNEPISGVQVVLSNTSTTVTGTVTDDTGRAVPDYAVVLFAEDNEHWGFMSRFIKLARPDQQGGYQVKDLPPGRYLAVAVETIESGEETDPALLERVRSVATPFSLNDGEQRALNLKLTRAY